LDGQTICQIVGNRGGHILSFSEGGVFLTWLLLLNSTLS
jgi:hypothetical protein